MSMGYLVDPSAAKAPLTAHSNARATVTSRAPAAHSDSLYVREARTVALAGSALRSGGVLVR